MSLIGQFGFKSGRDINKFDGVKYETGANGIPHLADDALSYLEAEVIQEVDAGTHFIFIGKITGAEVLREGIPMTYAHYHQVKKVPCPKLHQLAYQTS